MFANNPTSLENWHVRPAACDTPLTAAICCPNAQVLGEPADEGENCSGAAEPHARVARHLSVLKINRHVTAGRSEVSGINFLALNHRLLFLGLFSNNHMFSGGPARSQR